MNEDVPDFLKGCNEFFIESCNGIITIVQGQSKIELWPEQINLFVKWVKEAQRKAEPVK
jgi:hypothetical protein